MSKQVDLAVFLQTLRDKYPGLDVNVGNGVTMYVPPPQLWTDTVLSAQREDDLVGAARALVGDDDYTAFVAAGGSAAVLMAIVEDGFDLSLPE